MKTALLVLSLPAAAQDPAQMAAQAMQAAQQQQQQQQQLQTSTASGSGFRPLQAPVIKRQPKPAPAAPKAPQEAKPEGPSAPPPDMSLIEVRLPKEAGDWEPVSVRLVGGASGRTRCSWRLTSQGKGKKKTFTGRSSPARAMARLRPAGEDKRLVVSIFPRDLEENRVHIELRLLIVEGILDKAEVVAVTAEQGGGPWDDAAALKTKGVPFQEEAPASAEVRLSAVDPRPGKTALNAGVIREAEFAKRLHSGLPGLGLLRCDFNVREVR